MNFQFENTEFDGLLTLDPMGWFVLVMFIASAILCLLGMAINRLGFAKSAADRFNVWKLVAVTMLLLPLGALFFPKFNLGFIKPVSPATMISSDAHLQSEASSTWRSVFGHRDSLFRKDVQPLSKSRMPDSSQNEGASVGSATSETGSTFEASLVTAANSDLSSVVTRKASPSRRLSWSVLLVAIWLVGTLFFLTRLVRGCLVTNAITRRAAKFPLNVAADIPVKMSEEVSVPVTIGVLNPCILLPTQGVSWPRDWIRMVIKHETAHVARHDVAWQILMAVVRCGYWFQPCVWFANRKIQLDREQACDDQVLFWGECPCEYANLLLNVASDVSGTRRPLVGALPVAKKPIELRLASILDQSTLRGASKGAFVFCVSMAFLVMLCIVASVSPFSSPAIAGEWNASKNRAVPVVQKNAVKAGKKTDDDVKQVTMAATIVGKVVDHRKNPVEGANVTFTFQQHAAKFHRLEKPLVEFKATTNTKGEYEIETGSPQFLRGYAGRGVVEAEGYPRAPVPYIASPKDNRLTMPDAVFREGRKIIGRITPRDGLKGPVKNPYVCVSGRESRPRMDYFAGAFVECGGEGNFECWVPADIPVVLRVAADNFAGRQLKVDPRNFNLNLGDIELENGSRLKGLVSDASGQPLAGVVVNITQLTPLTIPEEYRSIQHSVLTDENGIYQFPPYRGKCQVEVTEHGNRLDGSSLSGRAIPPFKPRVVDLPSKDELVELNFEECETVSVSGAIRWPDGSPATNVIVSSYCSPGDAGGYSSTRISQKYTDEEGRYKIDVVKNCVVGQSSISVNGQRRPGANALYVAWPENEVDLAQKTSQTISFKSTEADIGGVDWEFRPMNPQKKAEKKQTPIEKELAAFTKKFQAQEKVYQAELTKRISSDEWQVDAENAELFKAKYKAIAAEFSPRHLLADELLRIEEKYNGSTVGATCLSKLLSWDEELLGVEGGTKLDLARQSGLKRLESDYLKHHDADFFVADLAFRWDDPVAQRILRRLQSENPHPHVQAAALLTSCQILAEQINAFESLKWNPELGKQLPEKAGNFLKTLDVVAARNELIELAEKLIGGFPDLKIKSWVVNVVDDDGMFPRFNNDGLFLRRTMLGSETYAEYVLPMLFEVQRLMPGQTVPEIGGTDGLGNRFRLSELRGKAVVLFFTADHFSAHDHDPSLKDMMYVSRELKKEFGDRPFEIVSICRDSEIGTVKDAIESGRITWKTIWDGTAGPIAKRWNANGLPSKVYLIDHHGKIAGRFDTSIDITERVTKLVEAAEGGPRP